jgi:hypothetical protein
MRAVSIPWRRCVGRTPTWVTPAAGTVAGPGTVSSRLRAAAPATTRPAYSTTRARSGSTNCVAAAIWASFGWLPKAVHTALTRAGTSSTVAARMVQPMATVYPPGAEALFDFRLGYGAVQRIRPSRSRPAKS